MTPLVTIYIPTKNRPQLLRRAVKSCLAQDYLNLEIIIIDDHSDAVHTASIDEVASLDSRIKLFRQPASLGACAARNRAIDLAQGEFVTGLDDDDEFTDDRISRFVRYWEQRQNTAFLCSGYQVFTKNLTFSYARTAREISWQQLLHSNLVGNQVFTRTKYLRQIGGFDVSMASCQDYDAWLRLSQHVGIGFRIPHVSYLVHQEHDENRISTDSRRVQGYQAILSKHQQYMSASQLKSQNFYRILQTENWSATQLLVCSNRQTFKIAVKNVLLRFFLHLKGTFR